MKGALLLFIVFFTCVVTATPIQKEVLEKFAKYSDMIYKLYTILGEKSKNITSMGSRIDEGDRVREANQKNITSLVRRIDEGDRVREATQKENERLQAEIKEMAAEIRAEKTKREDLSRHQEQIRGEFQAADEQVKTKVYKLLIMLWEKAGSSLWARLGGASCSPDVISSFDEIYYGKVLGFVIYKIVHTKAENVVVDKRGHVSKTFDEFLTNVPTDQPCYILYDCEYEIQISVDWPPRKCRKFLLISWCPDNAPIRSKMLQSVSKIKFMKALSESGLTCRDIEITDWRELTKDVFTKATSNRRERMQVSS